MAEDETLRAPLVIEYPFTRTTGPVVGAFFTALREGFVVGVRGADGRVIVPPVEYDPVTAEELTEVVEVGDAGAVTAWSWVTDAVSTPVRDAGEEQPWPAWKDAPPLEVPHAWALVRLDGADTALLHALDVDDPGRLHTGMRVRIRWRDEREGAITDIACFEPEVAGGER